MGNDEPIAAVATPISKEDFDLYMLRGGSMFGTGMTHKLVKHEWKYCVIMVLSSPINKALNEPIKTKILPHQTSEKRQTCLCD
jgi:hypothetical protein